VTLSIAIKGEARKIVVKIGTTVMTVTIAKNGITRAEETMGAEERKSHSTISMAKIKAIGQMNALHHREERRVQLAACSASEASKLHLASTTTTAFVRSNVDPDPKLASVIPSPQLQPATIHTIIIVPSTTTNANASPSTVHSNMVKELHALILWPNESTPTTEA
jgi:hypothetical protein